MKIGWERQEFRNFTFETYYCNRDENKKYKSGDIWNEDVDECELNACFYSSYTHVYYAINGSAQDIGASARQIYPL